MPKIGQKYYELLLDEAIIDGAGSRDIEVHDGQLNLKIWGQTTDGAELVDDGSFANAGVGWTAGDGITFADGKAAWDGTQAADSDLTQTPTEALINGAVYEATFTVSDYSAGNVTAVVGEVEGTDRAADGTFTEEITAAAGTDIDIRADLAFVGKVTGVSVVRKFTGWDGATVTVQVLAEDGVTWLDAVTKTANYIGTTDLGSSSNEMVRAKLSSAGNQTKVSCTASRG